MNADKSIDDFFQHFGIKGQRWGVRNDPIGSSDDSMGQNLGDGLQIASSLLKQIGSKRASDIPTWNEANYGANSFRIIQLVEKLVAATS